MTFLLTLLHESHLILRFSYVLMAAHCALEEDRLVERVAVIPEIFRSWLENAQSTEEDKTKTEVKHASKPVVLSTEYYRPAPVA